MKAEGSRINGTGPNLLSALAQHSHEDNKHRCEARGRHPCRLAGPSQRLRTSPRECRLIPNADRMLSTSPARFSPRSFPAPCWSCLPVLYGVDEFVDAPSCSDQNECNRQDVKICNDWEKRRTVFRVLYVAIMKKASRMTKPDPQAGESSGW